VRIRLPERSHRQASVSVETRIRSDVTAVADAVRAHHNTSTAEVIDSSVETQRLASITFGVLLLAVIPAAWQITKMTAVGDRPAHGPAPSVRTRQTDSRGAGGLRAHAG
jgi:hypothetical protein